MPHKWTKGVIYLIPKWGGSLHNIRKWRPITLNVVYKILAKKIARRLQPF